MSVSTFHLSRFATSPRRSKGPILKHLFHFKILDTSKRTNITAPHSRQNLLGLEKDQADLEKNISRKFSKKTDHAVSGSGNYLKTKLEIISYTNNDDHYVMGIIQFSPSLMGIIKFPHHNPRRSVQLRVRYSK